MTENNKSKSIFAKIRSKIKKGWKKHLKEDFSYENQPSDSLKPFVRTLKSTLVILGIGSVLYWQGVFFCPEEHVEICITTRIDLLIKAILKLIIFNSIISFYYCRAIKIGIEKLCCSKSEETSSASIESYNQSKIQEGFEMVGTNDHNDIEQDED